MPIYLGTASASIARKEHTCFSKACMVKDIKKGDVYYSLTGKHRSGNGWFITRFHASCLVDYLEFKQEEFLERRKVTVGRNGYSTGNMSETTKLSGLDEATKKRRKVLLSYLNYRDMINLEKAYNEQRTDRVYAIMQTMAQRVAELELMGIGFPLALTQAADTDKWFKLVCRYDAKWWDKFVLAQDTAARITLMLRPNDAGEPNWEIIDTTGYPEYIISMEGGPPNEQVQEPRRVPVHD